MAWRHFKALMRKNFTLKWRSPVASCCECVLPVAFVAIMVGLYAAFDTNTYATTQYLNAWGPLSVFRGAEEQVKRVPPFSILPARLQLANQLLGVVSTSPETEVHVDRFIADMTNWYSAFNGSVVGTNASGSVALPALDGVFIPDFSRVVRKFSSDAELQDFIRRNGYAVDDEPTLWAAIEFNRGPPNWDISYRFNYTQVPSTLAAPTNNLQRGYNGDFVNKYTYSIPVAPGGGNPFAAKPKDYNPVLYQKLPGFMTLQLMVDRWIINQQAPLAQMDVQQAVYSFGYMMTFLKPPAQQAAFLQQFATLAPADASLIGGRIRDWMVAESYAPQTVDFVPFPTTAYTSNTFYAIAAQMFALFFVICFLFPVSRLIRGLVNEKEMKIREGMKMMGLTDSALFGSWLTTYSIIYFIIALLITLITGRNIFKASSKVLVFFFFFLFGLSSITYCYLVSVFFSRAKTAATVGVVLFLATFFPWFAVNGADMSNSSKGAASLLSTTAFGLGLDQLAAYEDNGQGISFGNASTVVRNYSMSTALIMMAFDFFLYAFLAWYIDAVLPASWREFGVSRPWNFPCTRAYWKETCTCCSRKKASATSAQAPLTPGGSYGTAEGKHRDTPVAAAPGSHPIDARLIEEPDATLRAKEAEGRVVSVRGLRKEFDTPDGIKTAVDGINMTMYEGQIFVLLGHNGAGKSTTINMLTGMMEPTAGNMSVFGKDVSSQLSAIREDMGVCPQHDVLWPELTVKEHLRLYADIKGIPYNKVNEEIDNAIRTVGLTEKVDVQSRKLSGGQRRKLSVCIALMGGSRVIFLDEPTSGMDPYSRRSTWQILQNNRAGRVMVLTTHFMDEADLLGDRIAIMAQGRVQCCGNPMFLKNAYGVGYVLTIVKEPLADSAPLLALVKRHVPDVTVSTDVGAELALRVPMASSRAFPQLFAELDAQQAALHFVAYGVGITTMEEVFLKVAEVEAEHPHRATTVAKPSFMQRASTCFRAKPSATAPTSGSGTVTVANAAAPVPASPTAVTVHRKASTPTAAASAIPPAHGQFGAAAVSYVNPHHAMASRSPGTAVELSPVAGGHAGGSDPSSGAVTSGSTAPKFNPDRNFHEEARGGCAKHRRHFSAMLIKRWNVTKRDKKALCFQLLIPAIMVLGGLALLRATGFSSFPSYQLSTASFNINARKSRTVPQYPNNVPVFGFKASPGAPDAAALTDLVTTMPEANVTSPAALRLSAAAAGALPNTYDFINSSAAYPTQAWQRMSSFLLDDKAAYAGSKYGAYVFTDDNTYYPSQDSSSTAPASPIVTYSVFHNTTALHAAPLFMNLMNSKLYAAYSGNADASITVRNAPLPFTKRQASLFSAFFTFGAAVIIVMAFAFIPASYAVYVVKEREVKAKHQQLISGVSIPAYWLSTFCFDCISYIVPAVLTIVLCAAFSVTDFTSTEKGRLGALILLFLFYGTSVAAFTYMISYLFASHSTAQNVILFVNVFCIILMLASLIMSQVSSTCRADDGLKYVYRLLPGFGLGNGLIQLSFLDLLPILDATCDRAHGVSKVYSTDYDALNTRAAGTNIIFMAVETVVYLIIAVLIDVVRSHPRILLWFQRDPRVTDAPFEEDSDVSAERARVRSQLAASPYSSSGGGRDIILLDTLRKVYADRKVAVKGLSYGIPAGEVFGFLGINGAGKSTTLQMLSGDVLPSSGSARLAGFDIISQQPKVRRLLGYCPQWDALIELLTTREHLELFGRIKGVPEAELDRIVNEQLRRMDLVDFANKKAGTLSGGNKRKLSVAIALIGPGNVPPPIIFLDEPSTGMDPVARRFMWRVIADVATRDKSCSIILTTHSMEECEALCQRVGIMVSGRMQCLGSVQHLKHKFGQGYQTEIKLEEVPLAKVNALLTPMSRALVGQGSAASGGVFSIKRRQVAAVCEAMGNPARATHVSESGSGWAVDAAFERMESSLPPRAGDRSISLSEFATWWAAEDAVDALVHYITAVAFPGAALLERQGVQLRFQLPPQRESLGVVFSKIETQREALHIASYALGQTTLEQIFNKFARMQKEEQGVARGMNVDDE